MARPPLVCVTLATLALGSLSACSSSMSQADLQQAPVGTEVMLERSDSERPDWIVSPPIDKDEFKYFSGGEEGYEDYATGQRMAKAEAIQDLGESVMATWTSLLQASDVGGKDRIDQYGRTFQELAVEQINVAGVETEERYYEKVAKKTSYGVENRYNTFVLIRIPTYEWNTAQVRALEKLRDRARGTDDTQAEDFIDEAIGRLEELSQ